MSPETRRGRVWTALDGVLAAIGMWLAGTAPLSFGGGTYDDLLYIRLATSIAQGHWLGPFQQLTLARGPVFPLFLAAAALCRIPVNLAAQAVYLAGSLLLARFVGRACGNRPAATLVFALLALNPVPWSLPLALVLREKLYIGETMLVLGVGMHCLPAGDTLLPERRHILAWTFATGLAFAAFWLTREEGVWMVPVLAAVFLLRTGVRCWPHWNRRCWPARDWLLREALVYMLPVLGFLLVVLPLAVINLATYGVFRTSDFQTGPFPAAYGAIMRVRPDGWHQYGALDRDVRENLYRVSAAARELRPSLEGPAGRSWIDIGCGNSPIPDCHDLQGGWAMFALRNAVNSAGHYGSAREADRFYTQLAREIDAACAQGRLPCTGPRRGMLPPFRWAYAGLGAASFARIAWQTMTLRDAAPGSFLTSPSLADLAESTPVALGIQAPVSARAMAPTVLALGWIVAPADKLGRTVTLSAAAGQEASLETRGDSGIPAAIGRPDEAALRFQASCTPDCRLVVDDGGAILFGGGLAALSIGETVLGSTVLNIDRVTVSPPPPLLADVPLETGRVVAWVMRAVGCVAMPLAVLATPLLLLHDARRRRWSAATLTACILLLALLARTAVLAVGDATTVPALEFRFLAPGMSVGLALAGVVFAALFQIPREGRPTVPAKGVPASTPGWPARAR